MVQQASEPTATVVRTFLIADVRGYTRFTAERGDAAAALLAARFAALARDAVEARCGTVIELRGDEALAVFDDAAQAVRAALELQAACSEESTADPAFPLPVGIGIDAGEAVPVEDGFRGVALNMAARLCSNAGAGQVLVTRTIVELTKTTTGEFSFEERGAATFKGFDGPVDVIEAQPVEIAAAYDAALARSTALPPELDTLTPLVGREHELRWLRGTWRQVRRGRGRLLFVTGPALIGKTRLAAELAAHVQTEGDAVRYAGPGGAATATALAALRETVTTDVPALLIIDDIDVLGPAVADELAGWRDAISRRPVLVLALSADPAASAALSSLIESVNTRGDSHRELAPLGQDDVRSILASYAGTHADELPVETMTRASGGVPGRVHELAFEWARSESTRRLTAANEFLATARQRHASDLEFANNVIGLKLNRLYAVDTRDGLIVEVCPYKGLAQFEAEDSAYFFGRERLVGELAARTVHAGLLGVVGASGSGKSSVIAAGLVPSLQAGLLPGSEQWTHVSMRPGPHPVAGLQAALGTDAPLDEVVASKDPEHRLVLVVDQFEELFTNCTDDDERTSFVNSLTTVALEHPDQVVIVAAIRGDYYAHCAAFADLADALAANHVLVGALNRSELRRAIELPARRVGLTIESTLVEQLVEEVADEPGGLPFLSTALVELWQSRENGWVLAESLASTGGVRGAVARLAESSYAELSDAEQQATRRVLLRLVATGDGEAITRRRVSLNEFDLERDAATAGVIARLTQDRLLTMNDDSIEVAHEALLREWPRLQEWLAEDAQGRALRQHVTQAAKQWEARGREDSELYRGARLSATLDWSAGHGEELNELEREFLANSRQAGERDAERQRRTNRRLRGLLVGTCVLLVLALIAGSVALVQRSSARRSARRALAQSLGAQAVAQPRLDLAMLLAREAVELDPSLQTRSDLLQTLLRAPTALRMFHWNGNRNAAVLVSPNGQQLAIEDNDGHTVIETAATGRRIGVLNLDVIGYGPDGALLTAPSTSVTGSRDGIFAHNSSTLKTSRVLAFPSWAKQLGVTVGLLGFSGHQMLVTLSHGHDTPGGPKTDNVWLVRYDYATGQALPGRLSLNKNSSYVLVPNGRQLIESNSDTNTTSLIDARTARVLRSFSFTGAVAVAPDGTTAAVSGGDSSLRFVDLRTGHVTQGVGSANTGHLLFTPDSKTLVTAGEDGHVQLWDVASASVRQTLNGHAGPVHALAISADGSTLYTGSFDANVVAWDLTGHRGFVPSYIPAPTDLTAGAWTLSVSPDSERIAEGTSTGDVVISDVATQRTIAQFKAVPDTVGAVAYGSGNTIAVTSNKQDPNGGYPHATALNIWGLSPRPHLLRQLPLLNISFLAWVAVSPDGHTVAAGTLLKGQDPLKAGAVVLWDANSGRPLRPPIVISGGLVVDVAFSRDSKTLGVVGANFDAQLLDARTGARRSTLRGSGGTYVFDIQFSPDGRKVATAEWDGSIGLWDTRTGKSLGRIIDPDQAVVESATWSPDGTTIAATDWGQTLRIYDVKTRQEIGPAYQLAPGDQQLDPFAAFTPDGSAVVVASASNQTWILPMSLKSWKNQACQVANRNFTRAEWKQYVPGHPYREVCPSP